jgi:hypothetical protein
MHSKACLDHYTSTALKLCRPSSVLQLRWHAGAFSNPSRVGTSSTQLVFFVWYAPLFSRRAHFVHSLHAIQRQDAAAATLNMLGRGPTWLRVPCLRFG